MSWMTLIDFEVRDQNNEFDQSHIPFVIKTLNKNQPDRMVLDFWND